MTDISKLVRSNIVSLKPYSSARDEFKGKEGIFLDANENPFGNLNRYPDPFQIKLKEKLSLIKNIAIENIFIGNGSDEVIDILLRLFCNPGKDNIIICPPTYGMYEVSANINDIGIITIPLTHAFQLDIDKIIASKTAKMIFICSPNNPTGNNIKDIEIILNKFNGIVVVDEAYIDFSNNPSYSQKLNIYPNLIIMQTLSKAWGLAAARIGLAFASSEIITYMNKIKPPYNVSKLNQDAAIETLNNTEFIHQQKKEILSQRNWLINNLSKLNCVKNIFPTDANFILVEVNDANFIYRSLTSKKIITRNRDAVLKNCLRITVGKEEENKLLINELKNY